MRKRIGLNTTLALYNMVPNIIWTTINLSPIVVYCYTSIATDAVYFLLAISSIPVFLTRSTIDRLQIGRTIFIYKKLGVPWINKVAQNGVIINSLVKIRFPEYKGVTIQPSSISRLIAQTYMFEKFHLVLFLFYTAILVFSLVNQDFYWACVIFLTNILYNIYPNLLQQYIRLKLNNYKNRIGSLRKGAKKGKQNNKLTKENWQLPR